MNTLLQKSMLVQIHIQAILTNFQDFLPQILNV